MSQPIVQINGVNDIGSMISDFSGRSHPDHYRTERHIIQAESFELLSAAGATLPSSIIDPRNWKMYQEALGIEIYQSESKKELQI